MPLEHLVKYLDKWSVFKQITSSLEKGERIWIRGLQDTPLSFLLAGIRNELEIPILLVCPEREKAERIYENLQDFLPEDTHFLPPQEILTDKSALPYEETLKERVKVFYDLLNFRSRPVVVTSLKTLLEKLISPTLFNSYFFPLKVGEENREKIIESIGESGYERTSQVWERGTWTMRGGIVDVFTPLYEDPIRIEFFGDRIESIRFFDPTTQKSTQKIKQTIISPRGEIFLKKKDSTLLSYLPSQTLVCLAESLSLREEARALEENSPGSGQGHYYWKWNYIRKELAERRTFYVSTIPQKPIGQYSKVFSLSFQPLEGMSVNLPFLEQKMKEWLSQELKIFFTCNNAGEKQRLEEILTQRELYPQENLSLEIARIDRGFLLPPLKMVILTNTEIFGRYKIKKPYHRFKGGKFIWHAFELEKGDYVVHLLHGIGRYLGLREFKVEGIKREFLTLEYEGGNILYVPVENLHLLEKYVGIGNKKPSLSKLGSAKWRRKKEQVAQAVRDIASELIHIQALRELGKGFGFSKDTDWQKEFEASFIYEETEDQLKAIAKIKKAMEEKRPMDILLTGDAGYGKTEVALRASFKAVMGNKQVAFLVPTTILAQQHYLNFKERLADYPLTVEMLSRFRSKKESSAIIEKLKSGGMDIVIGTHRLLQRDVAFKNIGLLIIDEEQRFGVRNKEKLKNLRKTIDILTLTATPIPRTLYMALSGIRDISSINTPPRDRLAVSTTVVEFDRRLIREVIKKEIARGGQTFFLHNRVENIQEVCGLVKRLIPEARVSFAHGQMQEKELEKIMLSFINQEIDVLVTTTIIESGLDIPNANTIVINDAHKFGLADLYQLRGRVGRYRLQAYAYLLIPPRETLTPEARKRLYALDKFSHLGAGFELAMQDLEIRGAGNVLGEEQHGHIAEIGFHLYMQLLNQAVKRLKGEKIREEISTSVDLVGIPAGIPSEYISEEELKLDFYKRIAETNKEKEVKELEKELKDRFGIPPGPVKFLLDMSKIRIKASLLGLDYISLREDKLLLGFPNTSDLKEKSSSISKCLAKRMSITPQGDLAYSLPQGEMESEEILREVEKLLSKLGN